MTGKRVRISYRIEPAGTEYAKRLRGEYINITRTIMDFLAESGHIPAGQNSAPI